MNRLQLLFLLLLLNAITSFGQLDYQSFSMENTEWYDINQRTQGGNGNTWYWQYYTAGDTLVNGQVYTEIYLNKLCNKQMETNPYTGVTNYYYSNNFDVNDIAIGGIREADKRVYFYKYDYDTLIHGGASLAYDAEIFKLASEQEYLLYDFNYVEGDTIWMDNSQFGVFIGEEAPIDSHRVYEVRRYHENPIHVSYDYWVEGLGSLSGLFGSFKYYCFSLPMYTETHHCVEREGDLLIGKGNDCYDCGDLVNTAEVALAPTIVVAPNPSRGLVSLSERVDAWQVINVKGEVVLQNEQPTDRLDLSSHPPGIYFLNLRQKDAWSHHRVVLVE